MWQWHPRDVDALTLTEYEAFCDTVDARRAASDAADREEARRG
jgi:hypothetical protein